MTVVLGNLAADILDYSVELRQKIPPLENAESKFCCLYL